MDETAQPDDFAARYEAASRRLLSRIERACLLGEAWPVRVRVAVETALALLAAEPELGPTLFADAYAHGRRVQMRHEETLGRLAELLAGGREEDECPTLPDTLEQGLIGGATFIASRPLRAGEPERLPALAAELTALLLTPYLGRDEAARVAASPSGEA
jgi:hypothetical protein